MEYEDNILEIKYYINDLVKSPFDSLYDNPWISREEEIIFSKGILYFFLCNTINYLLSEKLINLDDIIRVKPFLISINRENIDTNKSIEKLNKIFKLMGFIESPNSRYLNSKVGMIIKNCTDKNKIREDLDIDINDREIEGYGSKEYTNKEVAIKNIKIL